MVSAHLCRPSINQLASAKPGALQIWLGATLFIELSKDNKRQEWLSRCHFGTGADKYPDAQTHIEQYKLALAG